MLAKLVFRADTLVSNSHCSISISVALSSVISSSACAPLGLWSFCCLLSERRVKWGMWGREDCVIREDCVTWSSDLCWPWGPWSLASWGILVPEHWCPGILSALGLSIVLPGSRPSQRRGHCLKGKSNEPWVFLFRSKAEAGDSGCL